LKFDFSAVDEAMFQGVEKPCTLIFCILGIGKCDLVEFACDALSRRNVIKIHNLPTGHLKNDFGKVDEAMFHDVERPFESIFYIQGIQHIDLDEFA
jgi:hypothetical protein